MAWTRTRLISEAPDDGAGKARAKAAASRAETQQKTQAKTQARMKAKDEKAKEKEKRAAERDKDREARQAPPPQQQQQQQEPDPNAPPPPMKILKPVPSPERAAVDDKNYGLKKRKCKDGAASFERKDIIKRMFKARRSRLKHLKAVTRTSLDIALGIAKGKSSASTSQGVSSVYMQGR